MALVRMVSAGKSVEEVARVLRERTPESIYAKANRLGLGIKQAADIDAQAYALLMGEELEEA